HGKIALCLALLLTLPAGAALAADAPAPAMRDGAHDFDFNLGGWKTRIRMLQHPLSGSNQWTQLEGTVVVKPIWGGKAQIEEIEADGPGGHFEGLTLFTYNPEARQWYMNYAGSDDGEIDEPNVGEFKNGVGEFYTHTTYKGRGVLLRFVWSDIKPDSHHVEEAFSVDGGKTWEPHFIADLTRDDNAEALAKVPAVSADPQQHGFDWQFGHWAIHMSRRQNPLTGSTSWTPLDGTVDVRKLWGGKANLAEIETQGPSGHLLFLALRLYNPDSKQWNLLFAHSGDGILNKPALIGEFHDGLGVFYDQESYKDRFILVRFTFQSLTANTSRDEQAFSADGGKTWEVNWINDQTRKAAGG
ncbi:MAG TPA: hypothetical protein VGS99_02790, partial [Gammaproteobacteria bacterium]|nr:hypothetical protein [Gammaproteobacteria bacterium]